MYCNMATALGAEYDSPHMFDYIALLKLIECKPPEVRLTGLCQCEYCGVVNNKNYGMCDFCGAPLPAFKPPMIQTDWFN